MAIKPEHVAVAGGVALLGALALSRRAPAGRESAFTVFGPSQETTTELLHAQVDVIDIFTSAEVARAEIDAQERVALADIAASERIAIGDQRTARAIARIVTEADRIRAQAEQQGGVLDFLGNLIFGLF